jgi:hypothetical protein
MWEPNDEYLCIVPYHSKDLMEWTDAMCKGAYPSPKAAVPTYDPTKVVSIKLKPEEVQTLLTETEIAKTKKLRARLEALASEERAVELDIHEWTQVLPALCRGRTNKVTGRTSSLVTAKRIAKHLARTLEIEPPVFPAD